MEYFIYYTPEGEYHQTLDSFDSKEELLTFMENTELEDFTIIKGNVVEAVPVEKVISYEIKD